MVCENFELVVLISLLHIIGLKYFFILLREIVRVGFVGTFMTCLHTGCHISSSDDSVMKLLLAMTRRFRVTAMSLFHIRQNKFLSKLRIFRRALTMHVLF